MKVKIIFAFLGASLLLSAGLKGQEARQIADQANKAIEFSAMEMVATLSIYDDKGNVRVRQIANASKKFGGTSKNLMKFLSPADVKGTAMLIYDSDVQGDDYWIYLPALRKTRRIVSAEKGKSFMGSEFSNADMSRPNLGQFNYKQLGSATLSGKDCWKIEATCINEEVEDENGFSRKVIFVEKSTYLTWEVDFYDLDNELYKKMIFSDYRKQSNGKHFAFRMEMKNAKNGRRSVIAVEKFQVGSQLEEAYFSTASLEKM